jgi:hypothetical protein
VLAQALTQQGRWLIDSQHRVVLIHGGNVSQLVGDAHLRGSEADRGPWQVDTPRQAAESGFNGVRLALFMDRNSDCSLQPYLPEMTEEVARKIESELAGLNSH